MGPKLLFRFERSTDFVNGVRWVLSAIPYHRDLARLEKYLNSWLKLPRQPGEEALCRFCGSRHGEGQANFDDMRTAHAAWFWLHEQGMSPDRIAKLIGVRSIVVASGIEDEKHSRKLRASHAARREREAAESNEPSSVEADANI